MDTAELAFTREVPRRAKEFAEIAHVHFKVCRRYFILRSVFEGVYSLNGQKYSQCLHVGG